MLVIFLKEGFLCLFSQGLASRPVSGFIFVLLFTDFGTEVACIFAILNLKVLETTSFHANLILFSRRPIINSIIGLVGLILLRFLRILVTISFLCLFYSFKGIHFHFLEDIRYLGNIVWIS